MTFSTAEVLATLEPLGWSLDGGLEGGHLYFSARRGPEVVVAFGRDREVWDAFCEMLADHVLYPPAEPEISGPNPLESGPEEET